MAPVRFSPQDPDLILVSYYDVYDYSDSYLDDVVSVIDWRSRTFVMHYDSREYLAADWTPEGDVLLAGRDGNVYLAQVDGRNFAQPVLHISTKDKIETLAVSPNGEQIAYTLNRHIWVSDFDGGNFRRLTGFSEGFNMFPEWSPDSRHIAFKHVDDDDGPTDFGDIWVVAADAESVIIRGDANTPNATGLWAGETRLDPFGSFAWR